MAEGIIGGILGEQEEKPESEARETPGSAEAFAAAIAAIASRQDPDVAIKTGKFLDEQTRLLNIQAKHLDSEHDLRLAHLRNQVREENTRRLGLRLRVASQLFLALVATAIGVGFVIMIHDAVSSRSVVIDPFDGPADLAANGLNDKVLAGRLRDRLTQLQSATRSIDVKREIADAWSGDIDIGVPETGFSFGQIERILKRRFGHDEHVSGDLVKVNGAGLSLTVRGANILPKEFASASGDLDELFTKAAEYVYGESQPVNFVHYLANDAGRLEEAIGFAKSHLTTATTSDRAMLLNYWANAVGFNGGPGSMEQAMPLHREALRLKPGDGRLVNNLMGDLMGLGNEEGAIEVGVEQMRQAHSGQNNESDLDFNTYDFLTYDLGVLRAKTQTELARTRGVSGILFPAGQNELGSEGLLLSLDDALLHDVDDAQLKLTTEEWDPAKTADAATVAFTQAILAEDQSDFDGAAKSWDVFTAFFSKPKVGLYNPFACWAAPAYQRTAQPAKADAALDAPAKLTGIATYVDCYRFRGDVLDMRGNWQGAQEWYEKAVKLAPSIPSGYYSWGVALAKHGELDRAVAMLREANQKGPHWADPLKVWGDVLVRQGKRPEALAKYDQALTYAPNWKRLKEVRENLARSSI